MWPLHNLICRFYKILVNTSMQCFKTWQGNKSAHQQQVKKCEKKKELQGFIVPYVWNNSKSKHYNTLAMINWCKNEQTLEEMVANRGIDSS